jgi:Ca-activated chloride channel homolog
MTRMLCMLLLALMPRIVGANAVSVVNAVDGTVMRLLESEIVVSVENQVAIVTAVQTFVNETGADTTVTYAFPIPEGASATGLQWIIADTLYEALISPSPQDTTLPGTGGGGSPPDQNLLSYLGGTPLFLPVKQTIPADSTIRFELTYAQLLDYAFGSVTFTYPNDYHAIQESPLDVQRLRFNLTSPRTIELAAVMSSHTVETSENDGTTALLETDVFEAAASEDYQIGYSLSLDELGLFSFSTMLPDSEVPDEYGGFFLFVVEPDPSAAAQVIDKVFTLIIDRSGSMSGDKIVQAREAAGYVIDHLNTGDRFNIVSYNNEITTFRSGHVDYTPTNRDAAHLYVDALLAGGSTNISGAFETAVPHFTTASDSTANIIVFFTDGYQTAGITDTEELIAYVNALIATTETDISVFNFGIGSSTNTRLLTEIARTNHGMAAFLGEDELETAITAFYNTIRNPVLIGTDIAFDLLDIMEVYPAQLPNLYKGQQMIVSGRYGTALPAIVSLSGTAFGAPVQYDYDLALADSAVAEYQFLPKVWAKQKIEHLLVEYYTLASDSPEAEGVKETIVGISVAYGIVSPFTSYTAPDRGVGVTGSATAVEELAAHTNPAPVELLSNYPNPFNPTTTIRFRVNADLREMVYLRIYNSLGQIVATLSVRVTGPGLYEVTWNGQTDDGRAASTGMYVYIFDFSDGLLAGRMNLIR